MAITRREFLHNCGFVGATVVGSSLIPGMAFADGTKKHAKRGGSISKFNYATKPK